MEEHTLVTVPLRSARSEHNGTGPAPDNTSSVPNRPCALRLSLCCLRLQALLPALTSRVAQFDHTE